MKGDRQAWMEGSIHAREGGGLGRGYVPDLGAPRLFVVPGSALRSCSQLGGAGARSSM